MSLKGESLCFSEPSLLKIDPSQCEQPGWDVRSGFAMPRCRPRELRRAVAARGCDGRAHRSDDLYHREGLTFMSHGYEVSEVRRPVSLHR